MRKTFILALVLCMVLTLIPGTAFAAGYVAKIGNSKYSSIREAVLAAQDGDTVVVTQSHSISFTEDQLTYIGVSEGLEVYYLINVENEITIDLNGKAITADMGGRSVALFSAQKGGKLSLIDSEGTGSVRVESDVETFALLRCADAESRITVNGGSYYLEKGMSGKGMINSNGPGYTKVIDGKFELGNVDQTHWIFNVGGQNGGNYVEVSGGTYNYDINHQKWIFEVDIDEPTKKAVQDNGDGTWTIVPANAYVNEREESGSWYTHPVGYTVLEDAFKAVRAERSYYGVYSGPEDVGLVEDCSVSNTLEVKESFTFMPNGKDIIWEGDDTEPVFTVAAGKTLTLDGYIPRRIGHNFLGWYKDPDYVEQHDNEDELTGGNEGTSYYAMWEKGTYDVKFVVNGDESESYSLLYGDLITLPDVNPTKESANGYTYKFEGWFTAEKGGKKVEEGMPLDTEGATYYARFTRNSSTHRIAVWHTVGNSFGTNYHEVPESVEINGVPVDFVGDGEEFTVSCIPTDVTWATITVNWKFESASLYFYTDTDMYCSQLQLQLP